jgi:hypothetical protein
MTGSSLAVSPSYETSPGFVAPFGDGFHHPTVKLKKLVAASALPWRPPQQALTEEVHAHLPFSRTMTEPS